MALRRPVARHTRATAALEFGQNDLDKFNKQQRQNNAKGRKSAVAQPVSVAKKDHQHSRDTTTTKPERAVSVAEAEDQPQNSLDSDSVNPPTTIPDADPELVIGRLPRRSFTPQSISSDEETLSAYYKRTGYLPPLSESTLDIIQQVLADPSMGSTAGRLVSAQDQQAGLKSRNVNWKSTSDPFGHTTPLLRYQTILENEIGENERWNDDLQKCRDDPQEFVFQRTVMMSMINRHRFIYGNHGVLDFAVERPWTCLPMPTRALREPDGQYLPMPKPDVAIAFRTTALTEVGDGDYFDLPKPLWTLACYEGNADEHQLRAFHFFMIESKSSYKTILDPGSQYQALNSASQSLHNMYEFFNEAGPKHLTKFFDDVRVFTAVSTTEGIIIRIHRACLAEDFRQEEPSRQYIPSPAPRAPILPDYPLQFEYDIYFKATADANNFTHEVVSAALETIMIKYGAGILLGLLKGAAKDVIKKFKNQKKPRPQHYYSHNQKASRGKGKGKPKNNNAGPNSTEQSTSAPSQTSGTTEQSSSHEPKEDKSYRENIEAMHKLNKENRSRTESNPEDGSPTPTPPTPRQTAGPDPNASLSENFGRGFNVDDGTRSDVEQSGPAAMPSQRHALPPPRPAGKRRGVPASEVTEDQPPAHNTRAKRSKK